MATSSRGPAGISASCAARLVAGAPRTSGWYDSALHPAFGDGPRRWDGSAFVPHENELPGLSDEPRTFMHRGRDALLVTSTDSITDYVEGRARRSVSIAHMRAALDDRRPLWETPSQDMDPRAFRTLPSRSDLAPMFRTPFWLGECVGRGFDAAHFRWG